MIFIAIQFVKPVKNIHPGKQPADISVLYSVPAGIDTILIKACKDCHSNNTRYPWYNNIQPVAWWLNDHINTGKNEVNFNEFASYPIAEQYDKIKSIKHQVDKGEMPLSSYTLIHTNAKLSATKKNLLITWSENIRKQIESKYPKDSLAIKDETQSPGED